MMGVGGIPVRSQFAQSAGVGPGRTTLAKTNGGKSFQSAVSAKPSPLIIVGPSNSTSPDASGVWHHGSGRGWRQGYVFSDGGERRRVFAGTDRVAVRGLRRGLAYRPSGSRANLGLLGLAGGLAEAQPSSLCRRLRGRWVSDQARHRRILVFAAGPTHCRDQADRLRLGSTITFTTPIHIWLPVKPCRPAFPLRATPCHERRGRGPEADRRRQRQPAVPLGSSVLGQERRQHVWHEEGFAIDKSSFRIELREFYVHDAAWAQPGGGGYAISLSAGTTEVLIENGISVRANKVLVALGGGGIGGRLQLMDLGYINTNGAWVETGLNASHMVGAHHILFEGNYGQQCRQRQYARQQYLPHFFRNHLRGTRTPFDNQAGGRIDDVPRKHRNGPRRYAGLMAYSYWMCSALRADAGWVYEVGNSVPYPTDAQVSATAIRHGNFDYVTNTVKWSSTIADRTLRTRSSTPGAVTPGRG